MTTVERRMVIAALVLAVLTMSVAAGKWRGGATWQTPVAQASGGTFYGANETWVSQDTYEWPQKSGNWCGIANIQVMDNYTYQLYVNPNWLPYKSGGEQTIVNDENSGAGVSQWGTPSWNGMGPGFQADIARDGGTDPRSIAWGALYDSTSGVPLHAAYHNEKGVVLPPWVTYNFTFHNVIYHSGANNTMAGVARALEVWNIPVSVTIAHGLHSDIVSGVVANTDPLTTYPATVTALDVWDPAVQSNGTGGYQSAREVTWSGSAFATNSNMLGTPYNANNGYDPDPSVGIYTPNSTYHTHWINYWTDIEPDGQVDVSPDMALDGQACSTTSSSYTCQVMTHP